MFLLATFVGGGLAVPALHRLEHAARWQEQAAAHTHGDEAAAALRTACLDAPFEYQDCTLCHRDFFSFLFPDPAPTALLRAAALFGPAPQRAALPLFAHVPIRAPPVTA